jgi:acyl carrier protein
MKTELENKLTQIFSLVFEFNDDSEIKKLRRINEVKWDSLAHVTLVAALENEFGINLDYTETERLTSYQSTLLLLQEKNI